MLELTKTWVIRDPLHGYIEPSKKEIDVIDTPVFQRLRGIKQLANAFLVFPGAVHTRFEHSLGTMHMASSMAMRIPSISTDKNLVRQLRLAALLHDIGHGPFSHVSEEIMSRHLGVDRFDNISIALEAVQHTDSVRSQLGDDVDAVVDLLKPQGAASVQRDIISSDLDADKLDYLLRDSHYSGVPYGLADSLRILHTLKEIGAAGESYLGISEKGMEAVLALKFARFHMHSVVYNHKVRRIADAMLVRATVRALEDGTLDSRQFDFRTSDTDFLNSYFELDDRGLLDRVVSGGGMGADLIIRLKQRQLFKNAYKRDIADLKGLNKRRVQEMGKDEIKEIEVELAEEVHIDPFFVIVDRQSVDNPTYRAPVGVTPERGILVDAETQPRFLDEMTGPWSSEVKSIQKLWVSSDAEVRDRVGEIARRIFEEG